MEVAKDPPSKPVHDIFGYRKIVWKIVNFFAPHCGDDWIIYSPEFCIYSPFVTKWRLYIQPKRNKSEYIYLERLEYDPFPSKVRVNWKLCYPVQVNSDTTIEQTESFEPKKTVGFQIPDILKLHFKILETSDLIVQCHLIVYIEEDDRLLETHKVECLKSLSQDLSILGNLGRQADTELFYGSADTIKVHRAILSCRNQAFKELLKQEGDLINLNYPHQNVQPVISVIRFLYTGNLKYVMRPPSLSIGQAVEYFDVEEVKKYYTCHELTIETNVFVSEIQYEWTVINVDKITKSCILSHRMKGLAENEIFRLALYPKIMGGTEYISLQVKSNIEQQKESICVHFGILDNHKTIQHKKSKRWSASDGKNLTLDCFVPRKALDDNLLAPRGKMKLVCRLHTFISFTTKPVIEEHPKMEAVDILKPIENLSQEMSSMFETGESGDITIQSGVLRIRVNKVILGSRSYVLRRLFLANRSTIYISNIEPDILFIIFYYMYSGVLKVSSFENTLKVYDHAKRFGIQALRNACSRHLQENFENQNAVTILIAAHRHRDWKLKLAALKFIFTNAAEIEMLDTWRELINGHPSLYKDFADFENEDETEMELNIRPINE